MPAVGHRNDEAGLSATSFPFESADYDLSNGRPLLIGFGAENYFRGSLCDLRIYRRALSDLEASALHRRSAE
jgi:hypothetical protein